ncbi:DUF2917 domain-containing protein [Myxococcus sp. AM011]|uniref:DUF2917 domain-containing protein n=1 Tax=Myxococcus sp. AM011 TaxID=2745200 RepID=UPI001595A8B7|nr:DUF2917 domain-containing protein [Myxococcus sp. AM011]NVJ27223.1 DUF2917 domain-containing protein [Myxococcus sp. AM011]
MESMFALSGRGWWSTLWNHLKPEAHPEAEAGCIRLFQGALWSRRLQASEGLSLTCTEGRLWLTFEQDSRDHVLEPGATLRLEQAGHVVVQALRPARFRLAKDGQRPSPP